MTLFDKLKEDLHGLENPKIDLFFHKDFDGVAAALAKMLFLRNFSKQIRALEVQYGEILNQRKPSGRYNVLVDYADGIDGVDFHTDHHHGTTSAGATHEYFFEGARSNAGVLFRLLKKRGIGVETELLEDIARAADCIDSAQYAKLGFTEKMQRSFVQDHDEMKGVVSDDALRIADYFAVNKLLLALKNRRVKGKSFLEAFVEGCESITAEGMIDYACELAFQVKSRGKSAFKTTDKDELLQMLQANGDRYARMFKESDKPIQIELSDGRIILVLNHESRAIAPMNRPGSYDRYVPFEAYPQTKYLVNNWRRIGLVQVSLNPRDEVGDTNLIEVAQRAIAHVSSDHSPGCDMRYFKKMVRNYKSATDLIPPKKDLLDALLGEGVIDLSTFQLKDTSWDDLEKMKFDPWELVRRTTGGHRPIANIPHLAAFRDQKDGIADRLVGYIVNELRY